MKEVAQKHSPDFRETAEIGDEWPFLAQINRVPVQEVVDHVIPMARPNNKPQEVHQLRDFNRWRHNLRSSPFKFYLKGRRRPRSHSNP